MEQEGGVGVGGVAKAAAGPEPKAPGGAAEAAEPKAPGGAAEAAEPKAPGGAAEAAKPKAPGGAEAAGEAAAAEPAGVDGPAMIVSTYPDRTAALRAARRVVADGLAACVNIADVTSVYAWKGRIEEDLECLAVFKTTRRARESLARSIADEHPYEVPEVVEIALRGVGRPYAQWLADSTSSAAADGCG